jgi:hypothetical protein
MRTSYLLTLAAIAMFSLAGCNKSESPSRVDSDVAQAAESAAEKDVKAEEKQAKTDASVDKDLATAQQKADAKSMDAAANAALTHAEGVNKVAIEQCEALSGDAQRACKDKADAALAMAKADVKAMKAEHK